MLQFVACSNPGLCQLATRNLSQPSGRWVFFLIRESKATNGKEWALQYICCAQDIVDLLPLLPLGYGKKLTFDYFC